jgi:hypothetical protein
VVGGGEGGGESHAKKQKKFTIDCKPVSEIEYLKCALCVNVKRHILNT